MSDAAAALEALLDNASVDPAVFDLRPDYRAVLLAVSGLQPGESDAVSEALLVKAECSARAAIAGSPVEELPHIAAWREAYRAFGAKPQRTRNSLEALTRRAETGLPRVNRLTDVYNAISVLHQIPLGGENLDAYEGAPKLFRAAGTETFDTTAGGEAVEENPEPGEVVWGDDHGVTCRRWNWRQGRRTRLTDGTTSALFILDALGPVSDDALSTATDDLALEMNRLGTNVVVTQRILAAQL